MNYVIQLAVEKDFNFGDQKKVGDAGEAFFTKCYAKLGVVAATGLSHDRLMLSDALMVLKLNSELIPGKLLKVELKTDTYSFERSENFFIESISNEDANTPGGPWRAVKDGIKYYVYCFQDARIFYWFDSAKLLQRVKVLILAHRLTPVRVLNKKRYGGTYYTLGYKIPRSWLWDLAERVEVFDAEFKGTELKIGTPTLEHPLASAAGKPS